MGDAKIAIVIAAVVACVLSGCARWTGIESGEYVLVCDGGEANEVAMRAIQKVEIDRDQRVAVFTLVDGSEIVTSFVSRDRAEWPAGCPTNIGSTHMEVLDIEEDALTIESVTFNNPILVRGCPPDPMRVVLREDAEIGGAGGACTWPDKCIFFGPERDREWLTNDRAASTYEETPVTIEIIASEVNGDIDPETFTVTTGPASGTVVNNYDGTVTYTPNTSFHGVDSFTYRICDIYGYWDTATITVTVNP